MNEREQLEARKAAAIDRLTERFARDDLPMDEYERLVAEVNAASSARELVVSEDIAFGGRAAPYSERASSPAPAAEDGGFISQDLVQSCSAILSERKHRGDWLRKPNVAAATVLASQVFDFTETPMPPGRTTFEVLAVCGEVVIVVPEGLAVRLEVAPVLGEAKVSRGVSGTAREGGPLLVVTGNAILGSVVVKRG